MSDATLDPNAAAQRAREIVEADVAARVEAVRELAVAGIAADDAERRLKEANAAHERAWAAALSAGWSEKDLRATGARAPGQGARRARAGSAGRRASTAE